MKTSTSSPWKVVRRLTFKGKVDDLLLAQAIHHPGVISAEQQGSTVTFSYLTDKMGLNEILLMLGSPKVKGRWQQTKLIYYQFSDQNLHNAAGHKPHCCNKIDQK